MILFALGAAVCVGLPFTVPVYRKFRSKPTNERLT